MSASTKLDSSCQIIGTCIDHILYFLLDNIVDAFVETGETDTGEDVEEDDGGHHCDGGVGGGQPKTE